MAEIYLRYKSVAAMLLILSLMMYLLMLPFVSIDMQEALLPWYAQIQQNGAKAVSGEYAIYAPPYLYLLYLVNLLPGNFSAVVSIKLVSIIFNFIGAAIFYNIVWDLVGQRRQALLASCAFLLVPTVAINAALWGQCDIIYTTFLLASFQATLKNRPASAMMLFGVALSFKLQSIFFAPYLMVLVLHREIQVRHLFFAPVVYAVMMVPAWIAGRPAADLAEIYLSQGNYYHGLSMSAPSVWALLQKLPFITYGTGVIVGLIATIAAFLFILYRTSASGSIFNKNHELSNDSKLILVVLSVLLAPYLLPKMHDRYFFPADVFALLLLFSPGILKLVPVLMQIGSLIVYQLFLSSTFGVIKGQAIVAMLLVTVALWIVGYEFWRRSASHDEIPTRHINDFGGRA